MLPTDRPATFWSSAVVCPYLSLDPRPVVATSCSVLEATSFELVGDDLEGDYVQDSNQFLYGRPVFRHTENAAVIYWTEVEFGRRRLEEGRGKGQGSGGRQSPSGEKTRAVAVLLVE